MERLKNKAHTLLRQSEGIFRTDMVYLARGGFWLGLHQIIAVISGLTLSIVFANFLSKETFGNYKFILSAIAIISAFSLTELPTALTRSVANGFEGSLRNGFKSNLAWSILIFLGGLAGSIYYFLNGNQVLGISFLLAGSTTPFITSASLYSPFLQGKQDFKKITIYGIGRNCLPAILLILTAIFSDNPIHIIAVYFISNLTLSTWFYKKTIKASKPNEKTDESLIPYSKHLSAMNILALLAAQADKVLIFNQLGAAPLAIYSFATAPARELNSVFTIIKRLAFPKISVRDMEEVKEGLPWKIFLFALGGFVMASLYYVAAPTLFNIFFPAYVESVKYSQVYAFSLVFSPNILIGQTLAAYMQVKSLYFIKIVSPIISIILLLILLPLYGVWGVIWSSLIGSAIHLAIHLVLYRKMK